MKKRANDKAWDEDMRHTNRIQNQLAAFHHGKGRKVVAYIVIIDGKDYASSITQYGCAPEDLFETQGKFAHDTNRLLNKSR